MSPKNTPPDDEQLASLASQHHTSAYNRSKFGHNGSPLQYLPLSLHLPEKFSQLRRKQLSSSSAYSWWPAPPAPAAAISDPPVRIQDEIMDAMSEPIVLSQPLQASNSVRTSQTHPINISSIIPPNLVGLISSHALLSTAQSPTLLDLPSAFLLDRLTIERSPYAIPPSTAPTAAVSSGPNRFLTRSHVMHALQVAMDHDIEGTASRNMHDQISGLLPKPTLSVAVSLSSDRSQPSTPDSRALEAESPFSTTSPQGSHPQDPSSTNSALPSGMPMISSSVSAQDMVIGNLLLSSCPGKKVRLDVPVKGRSSVCRDLETDIKRFKDLNVGCIICCLDDQELELLGSPWSEYSNHVQNSGIDILRMPIPEGLPPVSPSILDNYLSDVICRYTLKGISVLVHCRGGVGRAGVVACCWMIRLGLCGWPVSENAHGLSLTPLSSEARSTQAKQARIAFVQRVIEVIRKRRSVKAIETYEQVKFLLDYVQHLENRHEPFLRTAP